MSKSISPYRTADVWARIAKPRSILSRIVVLSVLLLPFIGELANGDSYSISTDGSSVVRIVPTGFASSDSFDTSLLNSGWTSTLGTNGSLSVTNFTAGWAGSGGAEFKALYDSGTPLATGQSLNWVQVITTNSPLNGTATTYLDNAKNLSQPFYSETATNRNPSLPSNQLNFYDYSQRPPIISSGTPPITWNASLYPVIWDGNHAIKVENGVTWGWTMKRATVGSISALFVNPTPSSAVVSGVGTSAFSTGNGDPSSLSFAGGTFDTLPGTPFKLGTLTYHNGSNAIGSAADSVGFNVSVNFDNVPEKNFVLSSNFEITNTPNTADPIASADFVSLGSFPYTFNVLEGDTASVDLMATLTTDLSGSPAGVNADSVVFPGPFDPSPSYSLQIVGLENPTTGGFVLMAPEPSTFSILAFLAIWRLRRNKTSKLCF